jgi:hypothetical protein
MGTGKHLPSALHPEEGQDAQTQRIKEREREMAIGELHGVV